MKVWILEEGKKSGPYESYTIRDRVTRGDLDAETLAWYDGAPEWVPLAQVPTIETAFKVATRATRASSDKKIELEMPPQLLELPKLNATRRFVARMFDVTLFIMVVAMVRVMQGFNPYEVLEPTQQFLYHIPYVLIDALMIHVYGTTIGKKLFGITLRTAEGGKLGLGESLLRSARVWVLGLGMFIIMPLSLLFSWIISRRLGRYLWDIPKNYQVEVKPIGRFSIVIALTMIFGLSSLIYYHVPEEQRREALERFSVKK